jgi:hypothetical protein
MMQAVVLLGVDLASRHPMAGAGRAWVEIEDQPQRVEDLTRGVPVIRLADAVLGYRPRPPIFRTHRA